MLVSSVLNFQTLWGGTNTNYLPYTLSLPRFTAIAWNHKKLPSDLQRLELKNILPEVEKWPTTTYDIALARGDRLTGHERRAEERVHPEPLHADLRRVWLLRSRNPVRGNPIHSRPYGIGREPSRKHPHGRIRGRAHDVHRCQEPCEAEERRRRLYREGD